MAKDLLLAIDQGTTGSTALVLDVSNRHEIKVLGRSTVEFPQHFPREGWVEHDLDEIWRSVTQACKEALQKSATPGSSIQAIGITNQRETLCVVDRQTGKPLHRAIVWQCKRSQAICEELKKDSAHANEMQKRTGLVLDPYFSGSKLRWLIEEVPAVAQAIESGRAAVGNIDAFLLHRLTGFQAFATEASNASRTMLFDIHEGRWSKDLAAAFKLKNLSVLPELKDSTALFGKTKGLDFLPDGVPITGILGDQQAALAGQTCFSKGEAKCTYGTGAFLLANIGSTPVASTSRLLTTVAWQINGKLTYALEGSAFIAGAAVQFLRDQWGIVARSSDTGLMAEGVRASPDVYFVPALAGLGAPHWSPSARGAFLGLSRGTSKAQMVRAVLEGIAFEVADLCRCMEKDLGQKLSTLRVDGGAAANNTLMSWQSFVSDVPVDRPRILESTALGAGLFAALGSQMLRSFEDLRSIRQTEHLFSPLDLKARAAERPQLLAGWQRAIKAVEVFCEKI